MRSMAPAMTLYAESLYKLKNKRVKVFLVTGVPMSGTLTAFDEYTLSLSNADPAKEDMIINYDNVCTVGPE